MLIECCILVIYKDLFGGQLLGLIFDYMYCLFDLELVGDVSVFELEVCVIEFEEMLCVIDIFGVNGMIEEDGVMLEGYELGDFICEFWMFLMLCDLCLQVLVCGDEGFLLVLGYFM